MIILQLTPMEITVIYMTAILTGAEGMTQKISTLSSNAASAKKISPHTRLRSGTMPTAPMTGMRMSSTTLSRANALMTYHLLTPSATTATYMTTTLTGAVVMILHPSIQLSNAASAKLKKNT